MSDENEEFSKETIERETQSMYTTIVPLGYMDVERAVTVALEVDEDGDWVGEQINEYIDSTGTQLKDLRDPVAIVYDSILQACRNEISEKNNFDIWNDQDEQVETAGNCICTQYDGTEEAVKQTLEQAKKIPEEDRSKKLIWFIGQLENMY